MSLEWWLTRTRGALLKEIQARVKAGVIGNGWTPGKLLAAVELLTQIDEILKRERDRERTDQENLEGSRRSSAREA